MDSSIAKTYSYNIAITVQVDSNSKECHMKQQSYQDCIEEKISNRLKCVPPWLGKLLCGCVMHFV